MIITQIIKEAQLYKIENLIKFIFAAFNNIKLILKDRTILTLPFKYPLKINTLFGERYIYNYYEIPFYTYDYYFLTNLISENTLLLDIGSHFGEVSYRFLKEKKGKTLIFEPNPRNIEIIKKLLDGDLLKEFKIFHTALGNKEETIELNLNNPLSYEGSLVYNFKSGTLVPVKVSILDNMNIKEFEDYNQIFIKIDVEGFELNVLKGMENTLKKLIKSNKNILFFIEIKEQNILNEIKEFFGKIKPTFGFKKITNEDYLFEI